jgi:hypothetical protein
MHRHHEFFIQLSDSLIGKKILFHHLPDLRVIYLGYRNNLTQIVRQPAYASYRRMLKRSHIGLRRSNMSYDNGAYRSESDVWLELYLRINRRLVVLRDTDQKDNRESQVWGVKTYYFQGGHPVITSRHDDDALIRVVVTETSPLSKII